MRTQLVINADDYGLSKGICDSIDTLMRAGAISSTTIMSAAPGAVAVCQARDLSAISGQCGVHLQVTSGTPLSDSRKVRSLIDAATGAFKTADRFDELDLSEVEAEWRRQIETVMELLARKPTHLDSHHGAHLDRRLAEVCRNLAQHYGLPVRGAKEVRRLTATSTVRGSDFLIQDWTARGLDGDALMDRLTGARERLGSGAVMEVVTHPGFSSPYLRSVSSVHSLREAEHRQLLDVARRRFLDRHGFELVSFGGL